MAETKQTSDFLRLNWQDLFKGLVVTVISAVLTTLYTSWNAGNFKIDWNDVKHVAMVTGGAYLLKNLFTDSKTILKVLVPLLMITGCLWPSSRVAAQSFTAPVPKVQGLGDQPDSILRAIRPVVAAAYAYPGNFLMTGAGAGYKHLKWDYPTQKWYSVWSVNGILWAAGTTAPGPQIPAFAFGPTLGLANDVIQMGAAYDFTNGKWIAVISLSIPLNN